MARNGSGTYSLVAGNPVVTGTTISSTAFNNTMTDIATALSQSISQDGQTPITANLPMGGNKITGLGVATATGEALSYGNAITATTIACTTLSASGVITSTVATGTAPFTVASTTVVANLNASQLLGSTWASPAAIGTGTPAAITGTNITANATVAAVTVNATSGASTPAANFTSSSSSVGVITLTDTGAAGANIKMAGNGGTTPNKYIRVFSGNLEFLNSTYGAVIATLTDAGLLTSNGFVTSGKALTTAISTVFSATPTFDSSTSNYFLFGDLTANVTAITISNFTANQWFRIRFKQDATGSRTVVTGNMGAASAPSISGSIGATASKVSYLDLCYNSTDTKFEGFWSQLP